MEMAKPPFLTAKFPAVTPPNVHISSKLERIIIFGIGRGTRRPILVNAVKRNVSADTIDAMQYGKTIWI